MASRSARRDPDAVTDAVIALLKHAGDLSLRAPTGAGPVAQPPIDLMADTPWGCETLLNMQESGRPLGYCWDATTLRWLMKGDVRPLAHSFALGYAPGRVVLRWFAGMLFPDFAPRLKQPDGGVKEQDYAYRLEIISEKGRKGRRRDNSERDIRDVFIARHVSTLMEAGTTCENAVAAVAQHIGGDESRTSTVRRAYDRLRSKSPILSVNAGFRLR